jgi:hypothetical protein
MSEVDRPTPNRKKGKSRAHGDGPINVQASDDAAAVAARKGENYEKLGKGGGERTAIAAAPLFYISRAAAIIIAQSLGLSKVRP